jgi:hypothetical protein
MRFITFDNELPAFWGQGRAQAVLRTFSRNRIGQSIREYE